MAAQLLKLKVRRCKPNRSVPNRFKSRCAYKPFCGLILTSYFFIFFFFFIICLLCCVGAIGLFSNCLRVGHSTCVCACVCVCLREINTLLRVKFDYWTKWYKLRALAELCVTGNKKSCVNGCGHVECWKIHFMFAL